ncbi:integral membrane sensor signal transduction histidine kinase [Candidatus Magnetoovum chiemensis]|nr:integral membrane sensor signal transduction histidine kinase [Candidatus Magnetoovum chiemensis]
MIMSVVAVTVLVIISGRVLSQVIVRPLNQIQDSMSLIAEGGIEKIYINSKDEEIVSLTTVFNKMLNDMEIKKKHLIQSEKLAALGTLLSGVAHELNNPLSNISTSCQILIEDLEDLPLEFKQDLLTQIDEQTIRAKNIVRSLLDFSKEKKFDKKLIPLKSLLYECIRFLKPQKRSNVEIKTEVAEDLSIHADKQRIQQALINLIENAISAVEDSGEITIRAQRKTINTSESNSALEASTGTHRCIKHIEQCKVNATAVDIEIEDTGIGIKQELLSKIFDPFFTTKETGKGSGLGLFIVYEIIKEHGGCITVESILNKGTIFIVRLPDGDLFNGTVI